MDIGIRPLNRKKKTVRAQDPWSKIERPFIQFCKQHVTQSVGVDNVHAFDERRIVFVSLVGLHKTWKETPIHVLYSCLILLPIGREWLPTSPKTTLFKKNNKPPAKPDGKHAEIANDEEFVTFLQFKNEQGFIFWAREDADADSQDSFSDDASDAFIAPFWKHVSQRLSKLYDPVSRQTYAPLKCDDFFKDRDQFEPQFEKNRAAILAELYFAQMKFKAVQEILYQSNPTLNPIVSFAPHCINVHQNGKLCPRYIFCKGFWISADYDDADDTDTCCEEVITAG